MFSGSTSHGNQQTPVVDSVQEEATWTEAYDEDFPLMMSVIDILNTLPPTSVNCETTFSQMKLVKTSRRTRLKTETLNDILMVKLESDGVASFNPSPAIEKWMSMPLKPRLMTYKRRSKSSVPQQPTRNVIEIPDDPIQTEAVPEATTDQTEPEPEATADQMEPVPDVTAESTDEISDAPLEIIETPRNGSTSDDESQDSDHDELNADEQNDIEAVDDIYSYNKDNDNEDYCDGFRTENDNWCFVFDFARD